MSRPVGSDGSSVSLCMIVRDEAAHLATCLASVVGVVDEIVVVDTGSEDETPAIAAQHGARVIRRAWEDDFAAARNVSLAEASGEWILVLDADEELETSDRPRLRGLLLDAPWAGARLRIRNTHASDDLCGCDESRVTRLFRNRPAHRYEGIIHEQITASILRCGGTVGDVDVTIKHRGYARRTAQGVSDRATRNLRLLERALGATPDDPYLQYHYGATLKAIGESQEARLVLERTLETGGGELSAEVLDLLHMKLAQLALADGRLGDAVTHARGSLAVQPANLLSLLALGLALIFAGDVPAAYPALRRARVLARGQMRDVARLDAILAHCRARLPHCHTKDPEAIPEER